MALTKTLYEEKINDDKFVYLFQQGRKKFVVVVDDGDGCEIVSSHSTEWKASESFEATVENLKSEQK